MPSIIRLAASGLTLLTCYVSAQTSNSTTLNPNGFSTALRSLNPLGAVPPAVEVTINGQSVSMVIDTGSSDTYVFTENTTCVIEGTEQPQEACAFGDVYTGSYEPIDNVVFNQSYQTNAILGGVFGYATIEVAGATLTRQQIAFVTKTGNNTFPPTSGLLGLAPSGNQEAAFRGSDPANHSSEIVKYPTVFESMYNVTGQVDPYFSVDLGTGSNNGVLTFGGRPSNSSTAVSSPLVSEDYQGVHSVDNFYPFQPDGFTVNGKRTDTEFVVIVDSGTAPMRLPLQIVEAYNDAFDPPAKFDAITKFYLTSCNATIPEFGVVISGHSFVLDPQNILLKFGFLAPGVCATGVTQAAEVAPELFPKGLYILGDVFLQTVATTFDVQKKELRFTESSSSTVNSTSTSTGPGATSSTTSSGIPVQSNVASLPQYTGPFVGAIVVTAWLHLLS